LTHTGVSFVVVVFDFLYRRIAPPQENKRPAWEYTERNDTMQLSNADLDMGVVGLYCC
jgi:hypothetical protein